MNVVAREGSELSFEITELEVAFKQGAVLQGLMSPFELALSLGVLQRPTRTLHAVVAKKATFFGGNWFRTQAMSPPQARYQSCTDCLH